MPQNNQSQLDVIGQIASGAPFVWVGPGQQPVLFAITLAEWVNLHNGLLAALQKTTGILRAAVGDDTLMQMILAGPPALEASDGE